MPYAQKQIVRVRTKKKAPPINRLDDDEFEEDCDITYDEVCGEDQSEGEDARD